MSGSWFKTDKPVTPMTKEERENMGAFIKRVFGKRKPLSSEYQEFEYEMDEEKRRGFGPGEMGGRSSLAAGGDRENNHRPGEGALSEYLREE